MGSWFSNIHIRKNDSITEESVANYINKMMAARQYFPVASEKDGDVAIAIVNSGECQWISVYSDLLSHDDPESCAAVATPISDELHTDVLGISCFDSDYLYLNLINTEEKVNAWIGIGSASGLGVKRRSCLVAWRNTVNDFAVFSKAAKGKYAFAEEFLSKIEPCLGLPIMQSSTCYEYLKEMELDKQARYLYFKLPDELKSQEPPVLVQRTGSLDPCFLNKPSVVHGLNIGGESKGLSVFFIGPYVEHEEITFSDVCFVSFKNNCPELTPIELIKVQLTDGQWAYYYHDPGFRIPPKVDEHLPIKKRMDMEREREIVVRFVPHGNPRKILDITVVLVPDKNPAGQTGWNVWHLAGSKEAYVKQYNRNWGMNIPVKTEKVRLEDFDI